MFGLQLYSHEFWNAVAVAVLCGAIVGLERELRGKVTGVRTCILVALGTTMFVHLGILVAGQDHDPTRVLGQVVTGIGFLGAGVILNRGETVEGVTTAATVWVLAAIGAMIGAGESAAAIALSVATVVILVMLDRLERAIKHWRSGNERNATRSS